ncbi:hypothetical protein BC629DRAFT_1525808 [Irpex lacteus]|nr:hypothetical protein BC629DRAFT_1525808 [Irpex lacteus]
MRRSLTCFVVQILQFSVFRFSRGQFHSFTFHSCQPTKICQYIQLYSMNSLLHMEPNRVVASEATTGNKTLDRESVTVTVGIQSIT